VKEFKSLLKVVRFGSKEVVERELVQEKAKVG